MPHRFFNPDEAAQYLNLSRSDLEQLVDDRGIPFEMRGDRMVFSRRELDGWASQRILSAKPKHLAEYHRKSSAQTQSILPHDALFPELIRIEHVDAAMSAKTKPSIIRDMVALAGRTGWVYDPAELIESLEAREALCPTAVPGGLAFLHPRAQQPYRFETSFLVLGRTVQPIHFGASDGQPTDLFFLLCCQDDKLHLHALARLCFVALETEMLARLRRAGDATVMHAALLACENEMLDNVRAPRLEKVAKTS